MIKATILQTFFSRFFILVLNFGLVILTTQFWGSEGRGSISILIANLSIIGFFANIFVGSSVSFFSVKFKKEEILLYSYLWSIIIGISMPVIFSFFSNYGNYSLGFFILLSISFSLLSANINLYIGEKKINKYNIYSILQLLLHVLFLFLLIYFFRIKKIETYFIAQILCYFILFVISFIDISKNLTFKNLHFSKNTGIEMLDYGYKTQISAFFQFLNYRLSYYFLEFFKGLSSVGIYSVGVAISETVWIISRTLSIILYSEVINSDLEQNSIRRTKYSIKISLIFTIFALLLIFLIPSNLYIFIFGKDFIETKKIAILLSPGILAIAASNIVAHYFSGIKELYILNVKSIIGLLFTIIASVVFIPKWGIIGACLITSVSYCISSGILFWKFYQITDFNITDFIFSKKELKLILKQLHKSIYKLNKS